MAIFVDSSALVTVYVEEAERDIGGILASAPVVVAQLTRVELPAAFWRKARAGELTAEDARLLSSAFDADYRGGPDDAPRLTTVRLTDEMVGLAAGLVSRRRSPPVTRCSWPRRSCPGTPTRRSIASRRSTSASDALACSKGSRWCPGHRTHR